MFLNAYNKIPGMAKETYYAEIQIGIAEQKFYKVTYLYLFLTAEQDGAVSPVVGPPVTELSS